MEKKCIVIIGDFVRSKRSSERDALQRSLKQTLNDINREHAHNLVAQFEIIRGDEYEGAVANGEVVPRILMRLLLEVTLNQRIGIGLGQVTTDQSEDPRAMDGPAFHQARNAIGPGRVNQRGGVFLGFELANSEGLTPLSLDRLLTANAELSHHILAKLTAKQHTVLRHALTGKSDREIAAEMGISLQAVNRMRTSSGIKAYLNASEALRETLASFDFRSHWSPRA